MHPIYVSTGAFKSKRIEEILEIADRYGLRFLELSSGMEYSANARRCVESARKDFNFLVHNYFPAPEEPFVLNLASADYGTNTASMELCKNAVQLVHALGGDFYSVHCGFTFNGTGKELGNKDQLLLPRISLQEAEHIFIENLRNLCLYARSYGIKIAIENNVVAQYAANLPDLYLGVSGKDLKRIIQKVNCDNLYVLLDLAHAKISNTFVKFGIENMIQETNEHILAIHLSENDGFFDQNKPLSTTSDCLKLLKQFKEKAIVLEAYALKPEEIKNQIKLISEALYR